MARTSYDQLMKQARQARFADFLRLFDPATADLLADVVTTYLPADVEDRAALRLQ